MVAWAAPKGVNERRDVVGPGARQGAAPELRYVVRRGSVKKKLVSYNR